MKEAIQEYAATVIAWLGVAGMLLLIGELFYGRAGFLAMMIQKVVEGR